MPVAVLLEIEPTVLQSSEMPVMSTKTRTEPLYGIITTHVTLNMSIIRVYDLSMIFGIVCARQEIASTIATRFGESLFMSKAEYVAKTDDYNLGCTFVFAGPINKFTNINTSSQTIRLVNKSIV